jgi:hypothetical protein
MPLHWSDASAPNDKSSYDHCVATTPLGDIVLEWKSWKDFDSPGGQMPWGEYVSGNSLDDAKNKVQSAWDKTVKALLPLCSE